MAAVRKPLSWPVQGGATSVLAESFTEAMPEADAEALLHALRNS